MKIGIIGLGYVGSAVYYSINDSVDVLVNDIKFEDSKPIEELKEKCNIIFVCLPTPTDDEGFINTYSVLKTLDNLKDFNGVIVLKSTILPKYIPDMRNLVYNPEFLNERTSIEDFKNQKYIVLGGYIDKTKAVEDIYKKLFNLNNIEDIKFEHCSLVEASLLKYFYNIKNAYKVLFWEFVHDITNNSRKYSSMMKNLPSPEMDIVGLDGVRGYGGSCLPKDVKAFNKEFNHELTRFIEAYNKSLKNYK